jgi:glycosyltransferase involved in cell wall biosynthesis
VSAAGVLLRVLRAEGVRGVWARALDHAAAARRRGRYRVVALGVSPPADVLHVSPVAPLPWLGGVPAQLAARRAAVPGGIAALLYPWRGGLRLELDVDGRHLVARVPAHGEPAEALLRQAPVVCRALGAALVHVEGAAGLSPSALLDLAREVPLLLSLHDFALVCPRANLFDPLAGVTCGACAREEECGARLAAAGDPRATAVVGWRQAARALLADARCVVFPSAYLRDEHRRLLGPPANERVVAPGVAGPEFAVTWRGDPPRKGRLRVAVPGAGARHKGSAVVADLARGWGGQGAPQVVWEVLGGGDPEVLRQLRRLPGAVVAGYYRAGTLARRLASGADLTLIPSLVPETYSLVLSESLAAGVPVLALAAGALAERLAGGGGWTVPVERGAAGLADALRDWLSGGRPVPRPVVPPPTATEAARRWRQLHAELIAAR